MSLTKVSNSMIQNSAAVSEYTTLQAAATAATNGRLVIDANVSISADVVLTNVRIVASGGTISGTGTVRGVITNDQIPYGVFKAPFNLSLSKNRTAAITGQIFVDSCLGDDANSGLLSTAPVRTVSAMRTALNTLIAVGADSNIKVVFRDGRYEVPATVNLDTSQTTARVILTANGGEQPVFTSPLKWYFRNGASAANDGTAVYALYDVQDNFKRQEIANSYDAFGFGMPRNQVQSVTLVGSTASLQCGSAIGAVINSATNKAFGRIRVTQSWTMSLYYRNISISGGNVLNYSIPTGQGNYYYNGFDDGVNNGFAPFHLENLDTLKTDQTWCCTSTAVLLPVNGSNIFAAPTGVDKLFNVTANRYTFENLNIALHTPTVTTMEENYTGSLTANSAAIYVSGNNAIIEGCHFADCDGSGIFLIGNDALVEKCDFLRIGHTAVGGGDEVTPNSGTTIFNNTFEWWGYITAAGRAIGAQTDNCTITYNICKNGTSQAIQTAAVTSVTLDYSIQHNTVFNCGLIEDKYQQLYWISDAGGIYHNGLQVSTNYVLSNNVIFNCDGWAIVHGIYMDNGNSDAEITNNLVFNVKDYCLTNRIVGSATKDNNYQNNILFGNYNVGDLSGGSFTNNVLPMIGANNQSVQGAGIVDTPYNSGKFTYGAVYPNYAEIQDVSALQANGIEWVYPIRNYLKDVVSGILRTENNFTVALKGSTSTGTYSVTRQYGRYKLLGTYCYFDANIVYSSWTGTGNFYVDLAGIPYIAETAVGSLWPVSVWSNSIPFSGQLGAIIEGGDNFVQIVQTDPTTGASTNLAVDAAGSIAVSGFFKIVN